MIHLIGCGGVGSYVAQTLSRMNVFLPEGDIHFWDGDIIEERNIDRQLFGHDDIGKRKSAVIAERYGEFYTGKNAISCGYFMYPSAAFRPKDVIFVAVDSLKARNNILRAADETGSDVLVIGMVNEVTDSEAWVYRTGYDQNDPGKDPRLFAPRDPESESDDPAESCTDVAHVTASPQTALANMGAAWLGIHLWYMHTVWAEDDHKVIRFLPSRVGSGVTNVGGAQFNIRRELLN